MTTQENVIKKMFDKRFAIPIDFDFLKHPVYPYGLKENWIVRIELNSSEKVALCTGDTFFLFGHCRVNCYYSLTNVTTFPIKLKNFII